MATLYTAHLVELCFVTQARRFWNGSYKLTTGGHDWFGRDKLGGIEGLEIEGNLNLSTLKITISGVDERLLAVAVGDRDEYIGRHAIVFTQDFDAEHQPDGDPEAVASGLIDGLEISRVQMDGGGTRRTITVTAPNIFYGRSSGSDSYYTHADQMKRFSGDRGLQYRSDMYDTNIPFPW